MGQQTRLLILSITTSVLPCVCVALAGLSAHFSKRKYCWNPLSSSLQLLAQAQAHSKSQYIITDITHRKKVRVSMYPGPCNGLPLQLPPQM